MTTFIQDVKALADSLHDLCDRYGYLTVQEYITGWLAGRRRIEEAGGLTLEERRDIAEDHVKGDDAL